MSHLDHSDLLSERYKSERMIHTAKNLLSSQDQSEEEYLGAQAVLLLNGLL